MDNEDAKKPPINFEIYIKSFTCEWNFITNGNGDTTAVIWITDNRDVKHELYVLDRTHGKLPSAYDLGGAKVRFFAHLDSIGPILSILHGAKLAWLIAKDGIMTITTTPSNSPLETKSRET